MVTGKSVAEAALGFVETPFVWQGRQPGVALDCSGVAVCAAQAAGLNIKDRPTYSRSGHVRAMREHLAQYCEPAVAMLPGRLAVFGKGYGKGRHLGVLLDAERMVQACDIAGKVVVSPIASPGMTLLQIHHIKGVV